MEVRIAFCRFIPTRVGYTSGRSWPSFSLLRFIPTRVGYTVAVAPAPASITVHPHSRGVYGKHHRRNGGSSGSSPLAWGILDVPYHSPGRLRFIPTRVGYTATSFCNAAKSTGSSPLAWGIRFFSLSLISDCSGSSPLAWGIH